MAAVDVFFQLKESGSLGEDLEARLRAEAETRLDPRAVEAVLRSERAEQLVGHLASEAERVIVVDPDPVAASLLQMRLSNAGLQVEIHRDGTKALAAAIANPPDAVISEVAMTGIDGFTLLLRLRKHEGTKDIPFIFVSERGDRASTVRGFELGADDFIEKPADLELLAAKVKGMIRKARARRPADDRARAAAQGGSEGSGGVAGSLADMGIVDILQVLASARKTVCIRVEGPHGARGELSLDKGRLVAAGVGELRGEEAVFELFEWSEGRFTVHAGDPPEERTVTAPLESLLLEACRRRDEAGQRGG
jgi:DNA-binding response OmpR family regulator